MGYYADDYRVPARSRAEIRKFANTIRDILGIRGDSPFPMMEFVERVLPEVYPDFELHVRPIEDMGKKHGETFPDRHIICLREDVYNRACAGEGRDRLTVGHETGHLFMHSNLDISMARTNETYPAYESSEWQANAFAGELLMPHDSIVGMEAWEVVERYKVSEAAAKKQLRS